VSCADLGVRAETRSPVSKSTMKRFRVVLTFLIGLAAITPALASGPIGMYAIVDKVVFEPDEQQPQRVQLWGAFAYVEGVPGTGMQVSPAKRGYLYFQMAPGLSAQSVATVRDEWRDLKAVAGTGQAVGFGGWAFVGAFEGLNPDGTSRGYILQGGGSGKILDLRVRPAEEPVANPTTYAVNIGVVKLSQTGSHAEIVQQLKAALKR